MTTNIAKLLGLVDQYPTIGRVDFDSPEHRTFINDVLITLKHAAPEMRILSDVASRLERIEAAVTPKAGLPEVTIPAPDRSEAGSPEPSNVVLLSRETAHNSHTLASNPSKVGTALESDRKSDNGDKPAASLAKLNAARKAGATRGRTASKASKPGQQKKAAVAPQQQPPATPGTAPA